MNRCAASTTFLLFYNKIGVLPFSLHGVRTGTKKTGMAAGAGVFARANHAG